MNPTDDDLTTLWIEAGGDYTFSEFLELRERRPDPQLQQVLINQLDFARQLQNSRPGGYLGGLGGIGGGLFGGTRIW